ncbi:hypothetical protein K3495_g2213 [Podosphaera aphanis]|nr:hypothetical protein K3495_g2213 [Podosphaera aphanis]
MTFILASICSTVAILAFCREVDAGILRPEVSPALQKILEQAHRGPLYTYPTSFSQGILPKSIHSHNDYWQPIPFYSALSVGAISIESDVWLYNDTLLVGHEQAALTPTRSFENLYIQPILDVLSRQNPSVSTFSPGTSYNGVFDMNARQTLYLWVDVKTDGAETWPRVVEALEPLRVRGYLSSTDGQTFTPGVVTVIGTGETPLNLIQSVVPRDYFWDAPIGALDSSLTNITTLISPFASGEFPRIFGPVTDAAFSEEQLGLLRKQVRMAHEKGIMVRYWDQPEWPLSTRNAIWRQLKREGVDVLNVDDVEAAAGYRDEW